MNALFDTDINLYLQSFQSSFLTLLMLLVSAFGSEQFLLVTAAYVFVSIDFKKAALLLQVLFWSIVLTDCLKGIFRPESPPAQNAIHSNYDDFYPCLGQEILR